MPVEYPENAIPDIVVKVVKGLSEVHADELKTLAVSTAEENIGMPSIFTVAECLKEWLADNNREGLDGSMYSEMMRKEQQKGVAAQKAEKRAAINKAADMEGALESIDPEELERIRRRQAGTQVTVESFNAWKKKFNAEQQKKNSSVFTAAQQAARDAREQGLTGKEMFQQNKAGNDDEAEALVAAGEAEEVTIDQIVADSKPAAGDDDDDEDEDEEVDEEDVAGGGSSSSRAGSGKVGGTK